MVNGHTVYTWTLQARGMLYVQDCQTEANCLSLLRCLSSISIDTYRYSIYTDTVYPYFGDVSSKAMSSQ